MKKLYSILFTGIIAVVSAQNIPNLPIPICSGTAEVISGSIYFFGGANRWSGIIRYPTVHKYDGVSWNFYDSIPDNNVWGIESALVGNDVYIFAGWPSGARLVRKYDFLNKTWTYLNLSPNIVTYGITVEYINNHIYLFNTGGSVYEYDLSSDSWLVKTSNSTPAYSLSSVLYNDEIYFAGFYDSTFFKYNPFNDQWTQLADFPFQVSRCAMQIINDTIYCAGGSEQGSPMNQYNSLMGYDIGTNTWIINQFELSDKRVWMADVIYNNRFLVLGGFDTTSFAVDIVEEIIPKGEIPVELISFTADVKNNSVELKWTTATEINNRGFEIERLKDNKIEKLQNWEIVGFVIGNGTTTEPESYFFLDENVDPGIYSYRLKQIDFDGTFEYSDIVKVNIEIPGKFVLEQNYPNPFNPSTKIYFEIPLLGEDERGGLVTLKVYDVLGNEVVVLVDEYKPAGSYEINFNASHLPSGIYFYQLTTGGFIQSKKMLLLK